MSTQALAIHGKMHPMAFHTHTMGTGDRDSLPRLRYDVSATHLHSRFQYFFLFCLNSEHNDPSTGWEDVDDMHPEVNEPSDRAFQVFRSANPFGQNLNAPSRVPG